MIANSLVFRRRRTPQSAALRTAGLVVGLALVLAAAPRAQAAPRGLEFFADGLTPESRWEEILKRPLIKVGFPMLGFGTTFAPITAVCVAGDHVRIADPRSDSGARLDTAAVRAQARASMGGSAPSPGDRLAAAREPAGPGQAAPIRYAVDVYQLVPMGPLQVPQEIFLFRKAWEIPPCGSP